MTEETGASATGGEAVAATTAELPEQLSVNDAGRIWADRLAGKSSEPPAAPEKAAAVEAPKESTDEGDAAQPEMADPSEETEANEPADLPPIEPPRSWTKEEKDAFAKWPREAQESMSRIASTREAEFRRSQNEVADARKAAEADKKAVETERERYLKAAASDIEAKEADISRRFPHIKSMDDVTFLANEAVRLANSGNPDELAQSQQVQAYLQAWRLAQDDIAVTKANKAEAEQRQTKEEQTRRQSYELEQNKRLAELVPEMTDPVKGAALRDKCVKMLTDGLEIPGETLSKWHRTQVGHEILAHASIQKLIVDGLRYRELKSAPAKAAPKSIPPVVKPGVTRTTGESANDRVQALQKQFERNPTLDNATALRLARGRR